MIWIRSTNQCPNSLKTAALLFWEDHREREISCTEPGIILNAVDSETLPNHKWSAAWRCRCFQILTFSSWVTTYFKKKKNIKSLVVKVILHHSRFLPPFQRTKTANGTVPVFSQSQVETQWRSLLHHGAVSTMEKTGAGPMFGPGRGWMLRVQWASIWLTQKKGLTVVDSPRKVRTIIWFCGIIRVGNNKTNVQSKAVPRKWLGLQPPKRDGGKLGKLREKNFCWERGPYRKECTREVEVKTPDFNPASGKLT